MWSIALFIGGDYLFEKFLSLDTEKQERIIKAAAEEFGKNCYNKASTNEIVKNAEISKGLLFHYFGSKKSLYFFLLDYSIKIFTDEFYSGLNYDETDFIERWGQIALLKMALVQKYPVLYQLLLASSAEDNPEIKKEIDERTKNIYEDSFKKMLINIDTSIYKDGMDPSHVSEIIIWVTQGFANSKLERVKKDPAYRINFDVASAMPEFEEYMNLLKRAFYKQNSGGQTNECC